MRSSDLKEYMLDGNYIDVILEDLGCGHISKHDGYYTCSNPDGDNTHAVVVYESETLTTINYTRNIAKNKTSTDIFDLISFYRDCTFPEALKYVHELLGLDYYKEKDEDIPESLQIIKLLKSMNSGNDDEELEPLVPISEKILEYYLPYGNKMFYDDGVSLEVQREFEMCYDPQSNYIIIPIRDSLGSLVGAKGRYLGEPDEFHSKFLYLHKCNKSRIIYGYWQNREYIKNSKYIYIVESEKAVQQLATIGIRNVVSTGGKTISRAQVELITRTGCIPIIAFDKDVDSEELESIADLFIDGITVYAIYDNKGILEEHESPCDNPEKWEKLVNDCVYKIKGKE